MIALRDKLLVQQMISSSAKSGLKYAHGELWTRHGVFSRRGEIAGISEDTEPVYLYGSRLKNSLIQREANCLVLDRMNRVVCFTFPSIIEYQKELDEITWLGAAAEPWYDGDLISISSKNETTIIAAKDSMISIKNGKVIFETPGTKVPAVYGAKRVLEEKSEDGDFFYRLTGKLDACYNFVYISPRNAITPWEKEDLVLVSVYDKSMREELSDDVMDTLCDCFDLRRAKREYINSPEKLQDLLIPPLSKGIILRESFGRRFCFKNQTYYMVKQILKSRQPSLKSLAQLAIIDAADDFGHHYPAFEPLLDMLSSTFEAIVLSAENEFQYIHDCNCLKEFSERVEEQPRTLRKHLFNIKRGLYSNESDFRRNVRPREVIQEARSLFGRKFDDALFNLYRAVDEKTHLNRRRKADHGKKQQRT